MPVLVILVPEDGDMNIQFLKPHFVPHVAQKAMQWKQSQPGASCAPLIPVSNHSQGSASSVRLGVTKISKPSFPVLHVLPPKH